MLLEFETLCLVIVELGPIALDKSNKFFGGRILSVGKLDLR
jgi:hypothetical protein